MNTMNMIEIDVERFEELIRHEQKGVKTVEIPVDRYDELLGKEAAYDMYKSYVETKICPNEVEEILFQTKDKSVFEVADLERE